MKLAVLRHVIQQTFCAKCFINHRQKQCHQLTDIIQEYDLLQEKFDQSCNEYDLDKNIDIWEKESIKKIQSAANIARTDLKQAINKSKEQILNAYSPITMNLCSSHEIDDCSDNELSRCTKQSKQFPREIALPSSVNIIESKSLLINSIVTQDNTKTKNMLTSIVQDKFSKVIGSATLGDNGFLIKHTNNNWNYEYVLGEQLYSEGQHAVLFQIQQCGTPYHIFFGCISSQANQSRISVDSSFTVGWFGDNVIYQHGTRFNNSNLHDYNSNEIVANDILHLIIDCEQRNIELYHQDTNKKHILQVDINYAPFPWLFLLVLTDKDDCIRILPTSHLNSMS